MDEALQQQPEDIVDDIGPNDSVSCVASRVTRTSRRSAAAVSEARTRQHLLELEMSLAEAEHEDQRSRIFVEQETRDELRRIEDARMEEQRRIQEMERRAEEARIEERRRAEEARIEERRRAEEVKLEEQHRIKEAERRAEEHAMKARLEDLERKTRIRKLQMQIKHVSQEVRGEASAVSETAQRSETNEVVRGDGSEASLSYHEATEFIQPEAAIHKTASSIERGAFPAAQHAEHQADLLRRSISAVRRDQPAQTMTSNPERYAMLDAQPRTIVPKVPNATGLIFSQTHMPVDARSTRKTHGGASTFAAGGNEVPEPSCSSVHASDPIAHLSITQHLPISTRQKEGESGRTTPLSQLRRNSAQGLMPVPNADRAVSFENLRSYGRRGSQPFASQQEADSGIAVAIKELALSNRAAMLPKSEILTFEGAHTEYQNFITNFDVNIGSQQLGYAAKLNYLLQYCKGEAHALIRDCVGIRDACQGYMEARKRLKDEYGKPYAIARSFIDSIVKGPRIGTNDAGAIIKLAQDARRCYTALREIGHLSEINSTSTIRDVVRRLPDHLRTKWLEVAAFCNRDRGTDPAFSDVLDFLSARAAALKTPYADDYYHEKEENKKERTAAGFEKRRTDRPSKVMLTSECSKGEETKTPQQSAQETRRACSFCEADHHILRCESFKSLDANARNKAAEDKRLCFNCLQIGHSVKFCRNAGKCKTCDRRHHTMLHRDGTDTQEISTTAMCAFNSKSVAFPIVTVKIQYGDRHVTTRAVLDQCSDATLCTNRLLQKLGISGARKPFTVQTVSGRHTDTTSREVDLVVASCEGDHTFELKGVRSVPNIPISVNFVASDDIIKSFAHLTDVSLQSNENVDVDMLIGSNASDCFVIHDQKFGKPGEPYAQRFCFGWAVIGPIPQSRRHTNEPACVNLISDVSNEQISAQVAKMWTQDFPDVVACNKEKPSVQDSIAAEIVRTSIKKENGRYMVRLPLKSKRANIPNNKPVAERRLSYLKRKLQRDPKLKDGYVATVEGYIASGYARKLEDARDEPYGTWYIPHHAVVTEKKPGKVRVVFDCAAKHQGKSLNDHLFTGPDIVNSLLGVLMRFRQENVAIVADVEAMYHRVKVYPDDQRLLRFLWWEEGDMNRPYSTYCMTVCVFGAGPSGFSANLALRQCADEGIGRYAAGVIDAVHENFYVDDFIASVPDTDVAITHVAQLRRLLAEGGFRLHKWLSTHLDVIKTIPPSERASSTKEITSEAELPYERTLGVTWDVRTDCFTIDVALMRKAGDSVTKRSILSVAASLFDPIGFLAPITLVPKMLMQNLFRMKLDWDEAAPKETVDRFAEWLAELPRLSTLKVERRLKPHGLSTNFEAEIHYFSDASEVAYGAVAYLKVFDASGTKKISFLMGKSRLAPMKLVTIPRLELCGAVVAARLHELIQREMKLKIDRAYFWCDSMTVIRCIQNTTTRFKTFVANRLSIIQELTDPAQWRHVEGKINPADLASRGFMPTDGDKLRYWLGGPEFLKQDSYPVCAHGTAEGGTLDLSAPSVLMTAVCKHPFRDLVERCGTWRKVIRTLYQVLRFTYLCRRAEPLTPRCMHRMETEALKVAQEECFGQEIADLHKRGRVKLSSQLAQLNPQIDDAGAVRLRGRLENSHLENETKRPIVLPQRHRVTRLLVEDYHRALGHAGVKHVLSKIRERFWILRGLSAVKSVIGQCVICKKANKPLMTQIMAPLPESRTIADEPPFTRIGVDYFGPILVRVGRSSSKRYGVLFTCLASRAIHIEVSHSLDTQSFLCAFTRFTARRGMPKFVTSDNGTNFTAAEKELTGAACALDCDAIKARHPKIEWKFIPPHAPHMGGVWERLVRSVKGILYTLLNAEASRPVTDETLVTLLCEVEAILNDRPITTNPDAVEEPLALTPNMLLTFRRRPTIPPGTFDARDLYARRWWRQAQHLSNVFWARWTREYLLTLQLRQKWTHAVPDLKINDIVLVRDEQAPRGDWPLGLVTRLHHSSDGVARSAEVRVRGKLKTRPIAKLVQLEHHRLN